MGPLEIVLEIVKLTIPGLVVFGTVYVLLKHLGQQMLAAKGADQQAEARKVTIQFRLQAYERLSLYCERISIPNLIIRLRADNMTPASLKWAMLMAIQQEFEHNITQQIYVSESLWKILQLAREQVMASIDQVAVGLDRSASTEEFIAALFQRLAEQEADPLKTALSAIKKEASLVL